MPLDPRRLAVGIADEGGELNGVLVEFPFLPGLLDALRFGSTLTLSSWGGIFF